MEFERHFVRELQRISEMVLRMGAGVEESIGDALRSLLERDPELARQVLAQDERLDQLELEIDQVCTDVIALHQPTARDLRFVITALKIAPELERIGDLAGNVAERSIELAQEPPLKALIDIPRMAHVSAEMLRRGLDAFVQHDAEAARQVIRMDDEVDGLMEQLFRELLSYMLEDPRTISRALRLMMVAKYIERMADQVTNICEMVVYLVEARVIRHGGPHPVDGEPR